MEIQDGDHHDNRRTNEPEPGAQEQETNVWACAEHAQSPF